MRLRKEAVSNQTMQAPMVQRYKRQNKSCHACRKQCESSFCSKYGGKPGCVVASCQGSRFRILQTAAGRPWQTRTWWTQYTVSRLTRLYQLLEHYTISYWHDFSRSRYNDDRCWKQNIWPLKLIRPTPFIHQTCSYIQWWWISHGSILTCSAHLSKDCKKYILWWSLLEA